MKKFLNSTSCIGLPAFLGIFAAGFCEPVFATVTLDTGFNPAFVVATGSGYSLPAVTADGTYYFHDNEADKLVKVSASGVLDTTFNPQVSNGAGARSGFFEAKPLENNGLLITGFFGVNGSPFLAAKLLPSGMLDPSFTSVAPPSGDIYNVVTTTMANGELLLNYSGWDPTGMISTGGVMAVRTNGQVVAGFPPVGPQSSAAVQADGKLLVAGYPLQVNGQQRLFARYGQDYQRDPGFDAPSFVYTQGTNYFGFNVRDFAWGYFANLEYFKGSDVTLNGEPAKRLYRLQLNGSLAPNFTPWSPPIPAGGDISTYIEDVSVDASGNGRVLLQSEEYDGGFTATRKFHILDAASGAVDTSFNSTVLTGGSSYVYGEFVGSGVRLSVEDANQVNGQTVPANASFALLGPTGAVASYETNNFPLIEGVDSWNPGPRIPVTYVEKLLLSDGSTLVTSTYPAFTHVNGQPASGILRVKPDGSIDTEFNLVPGYLPEQIGKMVSVREEFNNRLLLTGNFTSINGVARPGAARVSYESVAGPSEWTGFYSLPSSPAALSSTDTDGDGVVDLLELAFRLHPRQVDGAAFTAASGRGLPAAGFQPAIGQAAPKLRLTFPRRRDRGNLGLTYLPLFSSSLSEVGTAGVEISSTPADATWEIVLVEDPGAADGLGRRFARVRVGL